MRYLRTLFESRSRRLAVGCVLLAMVLGSVGYSMQRHVRRQAAIARIHHIGTVVVGADIPPWITLAAAGANAVLPEDWKLRPDDWSFFEYVYAVELKNHRMSKADLDNALNDFELLSESQLLNASSRNIGDDFPARLGGFRKLKCVTFGPAISDTGLTALSTALPLEYLFLRRTSVTDEGLSHLSRFPGLTTVDLSDTNISGIGLTHLSKLRLTTLYLSRTQVDDAGLRALEGMPLQYLHLDKTNVTDVGLASISNLLTLEVLSIEGIEVTDAGLARLSRLPQLVSLFLRSSKVTGTGFTYLKSLPQLETLGCAGMMVTDNDLRHFKDFPRLQTLNLRSTQITAKALSILNECPHLQYVSASVDNISDEDWTTFRAKFPLSKLELSRL